MAKIFLIDDDPDVRTVMSATLQRQGYEVETASGRDEAFAKLQRATPALIMMDVLLSGADGRELCREFKSNERTKHIPIIMFSGHPGAALKFEAYGADDFIAKPFNTEDLLAKLNRQMGTVK